MPTLDEAKKIVRQLSDDDRDELRRLLDELDEQLWQRERRDVSRRASQTGLTDAAIDDAFRNVRHEGRS